MSDTYGDTYEERKPKKKNRKILKEAIPEHNPRRGRRLGRHLHHDEASKQYPMADLLDRSIPLASKRWTRRIPAFDQGNLGSCTGNGLLGHLATAPLHQPAGWKGLHYIEPVAVELYSRATVIDGFGGQYPPDDTGSSGLAVCQAAQEKGWIDNYVWGFTLDDTLRWLSQKGSCIIGTIFTADMFTPDANGFLRPTGSVEGGHEYELTAIEITDATPGKEQGWVEMENSWTSRWGKRGRAKIAFPDLKTLLIDNEGDAKAGIRNAA